MFSHQAVNKSGHNVNVQDFDLVGLYFSAHWCPPCRGFTPKLAEAYNTWKSQDNSIEIIFVSHDQDEGSQMNYYAMMPWARVPYNQQVLQQTQQQFQVSGIPCLVIMDRGCNKIITKNGWQEVGQQGPAAINNWKPQNKPVPTTFSTHVPTNNSDFARIFSSESGQIKGFQNTWSDTLIELPDNKTVKLSYEVRSLSDNAEFIGAFSLNKAQFGKNPDALTWYGATNRCDFTFRSQMFGGYPPSQEVSNKNLAKGTWHLFEVELSKNSARYSVNGEVFATMESGGYWPTSGYFGFAGYDTEWEWRNVKYFSG